MTRLNLKYTARDIANIEDEFDSSIEKIISSFKVKTLISFLRYGIRDENNNRPSLSLEDIHKLVDEKISEFGKIELQIQVIEALMESGFLPKALDTELLRKNLSEALQEVSENAGENTKLMQSE